MPRIRPLCVSVAWRRAVAHAEGHSGLARFAASLPACAVTMGGVRLGSQRLGVSAGNTRLAMVRRDVLPWRYGRHDHHPH